MVRTSPLPANKCPKPVSRILRISAHEEIGRGQTISHLSLAIRSLKGERPPCSARHPSRLLGRCSHLCQEHLWLWGCAVPSSPPGQQKDRPPLEVAARRRLMWLTRLPLRAQLSQEAVSKSMSFTLAGLWASPPSCKRCSWLAFAFLVTTSEIAKATAQSRGSSACSRRRNVCYKIELSFSDPGLGRSTMTFSALRSL